MCVIALTKPGAWLTAAHLRAMFGTNKDGAGIAWIDKDGDIHCRKGFMTEKSFIDGYQRNILDSRVYEKHPTLLHCRIATLGKVCMDNCHPFKIKGGMLAHNGTLWHGSKGISLEAEKSDTREYAERMFNNLTYEETDLAADQLGRAIKPNNKLVMLYKGGKYVIVNEDQGTWQDRVWYSNLRWYSAFIKDTGLREQDERDSRPVHGVGRHYQNT